MWVVAPNFVFLDENFLIGETFSDSHKFRAGNCCPAHVAM